jgi:hypothetical protein
MLQGFGNLKEKHINDLNGNRTSDLPASKTKAENDFLVHCQ